MHPSAEIFARLATETQEDGFTISPKDLLEANSVVAVDIRQEQSSTAPRIASIENVTKRVNVAS